MSLINQMLKDLAQRQAPSNQAPGQIAAINAPSMPKAMPVWGWITLAILVNVTVLAWFGWHSNAHPAARPATPPVAENKVKIETAPKLAVHVRPVPQPSAVTHITTPINRHIPAQALAQTTAPVILPALPAIQTAPQTHQPTPPATLTQASQATLTASAPAPQANQSAPPIAQNIDSAPRPTEPAIQAEQLPAAPSKTTINKQIKPLTQTQIARNEYLKAISLAQQGDINAGITGLIHVLSLDPNFHQARLMLVGLLIEHQRSAEADRYLQESLATNPEQTDFAMLLARLQLEHGDLNQSIATLMRSLPFAANQAPYQAFLAALLQRAGKNEQAVEHYVIALKQNPQSGLWWMGLGISERALKHASEAREAFIRAKATNSLNPDLQAFIDQQLQ